MFSSRTSPTTNCCDYYNTLKCVFFTLQEEKGVFSDRTYNAELVSIHSTVNGVYNFPFLPVSGTVRTKNDDDGEHASS